MSEYQQTWSLILNIIRIEEVTLPSEVNTGQEEMLAISIQEFELKHHPQGPPIPLHSEHVVKLEHGIGGGV